MVVIDGGVAMSTTETPPKIDTTPDIGVERKEGILPPWTVVLHNDDHNEMLYVVRCLVKSVPNLGAARATQIMLEAHNHGKAVVTTCPLELAELYRDRLESCGLTATIEKA
jgi:ATP-dependent Clp protease adaptor protein ClpS